MPNSRRSDPPCYSEAMASQPFSPPRHTRPVPPQVHDERLGGAGERVYFVRTSQQRNYTHLQPPLPTATAAHAAREQDVFEDPHKQPFEFKIRHLGRYAALALLIIAYLFASIPLFYKKSEYDHLCYNLHRARFNRDTERRQWLHEQEVHKKEEERWQQQWQQQREEWEIEKEAHRPYFEEPVLKDVYCRAYNTREYKARLWNVRLPGENWMEACMSTEVRIHGRTIGQPNRCVDEVCGLFLPGDFVRVLTFLM